MKNSWAGKLKKNAETLAVVGGARWSDGWWMMMEPSQKVIQVWSGKKLKTSN